MAFTIEQAEKALLDAAQDYHVDSANDDKMRVIRAALVYADVRYPPPQAAMQPVGVAQTMMNAVNRSTVDEIQRHVLNFFEGNWEKVDAWFAAFNPAFGLSPNDMIAHGRHVYLLTWVRHQVEENKESK